METLKKTVKNQYFPAGAVLAAVVSFWTVAMFGGLSLLHNNQPPLATLTWLLFVYSAAVLTPLAGVIAATDLIRRWLRNRGRYAAEAGEDAAFPLDQSMEPAGGHVAQAVEQAPRLDPGPARPAPSVPVNTGRPSENSPAKSRPPKKTDQARQRKKAA